MQSFSTSLKIIVCVVKEKEEGKKTHYCNSTRSAKLFPNELNCQEMCMNFANKMNFWNAHSSAEEMLNREMRLMICNLFACETNTHTKHKKFQWRIELFFFSFWKRNRWEKRERVRGERERERQKAKETEIASNGSHNKVLWKAQTLPQITQIHNNLTLCYMAYKHTYLAKWYVMKLNKRNATPTTTTAAKIWPIKRKTMAKVASIKKNHMNHRSDRSKLNRIKKK